jgi:putative ABC transport system substrate-binding protein
LRLAPDVVLSNALTATTVLQQAIRTVPIVFVVVSEPVERGFVATLAHPGGNVTGFAYLEPSIGSKWVELLHEIAPRATRIAIIFNPATALNAALYSYSAEMASAALSYAPPSLAPVHGPTDFETVMLAMSREPGGGLIFAPDTFTVVHRKFVVELVARHRLPAIYSQRSFIADGGLISYGADIPDQFRRAAAYVDRILRGEKPADLPVQQPTKFELVINLKTAKELSLDVSPTLLARADEVIE